MSCVSEHDPYFCDDEGNYMSYREPPDNDHDTLLALWHAIIGTNGSGIMERVKRLEEKGRNRWLIIKDIVLSAGLIGFIFEIILKSFGG